MRTPELLYHYTSLEAFRSIVESKRFLLQRADKMRDSKEYRVGFDFLDGILKQYSHDHPNLRETINLLWNGIKYHNFRDHIFIACFTTSYRNPYLWEHYADDYRGVLLALDLNQIRERYRIDDKSLFQLAIYEVDYRFESYTQYVLEHLQRIVPLDVNGLKQLGNLARGKKLGWDYVWRHIQEDPLIKHNSAIFVDLLVRAMMLKSQLGNNGDEHWREEEIRVMHFPKTSGGMHEPMPFLGDRPYIDLGAVPIKQVIYRKDSAISDRWVDEIGAMFQHLPPQQRPIIEGI